MATQCRFLEPMGCFLFEVMGPDPIRQCLNAAEEMMSHDQFKPGMPAIWDLREADLSDITADQAAIGARTNTRTKQVRGKAKVALVVRNELSYGMMRVYMAYGSVDHLDMAIFYSLAEAEDWIR